MSTDFEWQIGDDESEGPWQPARAPRPAPPPPPRPPRFSRLRRLPRWAWIAIAAAIIAAIGVPARLVALRLQQIGEEQRAAVLHLARLEDQLIAEGDVDALMALQDPTFPDWQSWQRLNTSQAAHVVTDTHAPLLVWGSSAINRFEMATQPAYGPVRLDGERAELVVTRYYQATEWQGAAAPVFDLSVKQYYRFANGGWLRTAPPDTVYTRMRRGPGAELRLLYPEVDHDLLDSYTQYFQSIATRACQDLGCPRGIPALILSAIPGELVRGQAGRPGTAGEIYLPAPALLGMPGNAQGQDALFRLYAIRLVEAIGARAIAARGESVEPWLAWELAHLGLEAPLDPARLRDAARQAVNRGRMTALLTPELRTEGVWLMLDFLAGPAGKSPLRPLLADENAVALSDQLVQVLRERYWEWWDYLGTVAAPEAQYDTAAQLGVVCNNQAMIWSAATGTLRPLGAGADLLLWSPSGKRLIANSWRDGFTVIDIEQGPLHNGTDTPLAWAPDEEWIAIDAEIDLTRYLWHLGYGKLIDVAYGPGWIGWSPDGRHLAYAVDEEELYLALPDASEPKLVANGNRAAWSADSRYLAIAANNLIDAPVYVYDLQTSRLATVIAHAEGVLYDFAWTAAGAPVQLVVASHAPHAQPETAGRIRVLSPQGEVLHDWRLAGVPFDVEWAPGARRLGWALAPLQGGTSEIWMAGLEDERVENLAAASDSGYILSWHWSPAGDWIALDNGGVTVVSADYATARRLPDGCRAPSWRPQLGNEQ